MCGRDESVRDANEAERMLAGHQEAEQLAARVEASAEANVPSLLRGLLKDLGQDVPPEAVTASELCATLLKAVDGRLAEQRARVELEELHEWLMVTSRRLCNGYRNELPNALLTREIDRELSRLLVEHRDRGELLAGRNPRYA